MSTTSPAWKNPRERMAKHLKRKSSMRLVMPTVDLTALGDLNTESCPPISTTVTPLRSNPFSLNLNSPSKKKKKLTTSADDGPKEFFDWDDSAANDSFSSVAASKISQASPHLSRSMSAQIFGEPSLLDFSGLGGGTFMVSPTQSPSTSAVEQRRSESIPVDFRLGTKLRITSKVPMPWMKNAKSTGNVLVRMNGSEMSEGMQCFMQMPTKAGQIVASPLSYSPNALLEAACLYWQYPSLPWLSLFPRIDSLLKSQPKQTAPPLAPPMIDVINKQWKESMEQLFMSWKKGEREQFYVVCPTFTVHFYKTDKVDGDVMDPTEDSMSCFVAEGRRHVAVISPTNFHFRRFLTEEGVDFELCSYKKRRLSRAKSTENTENSVDATEVSLLSPETSSSGIATDEAAGGISFEKENDAEEQKNNSSGEDESPTKSYSRDQEWLKDVGISPSNRRKLSRHRSLISTMTKKKTGPGKTDMQKDETSAVIITGSSLQAIYNLLQTSTKVTRAIAGVHAQLPPTLLAERPFLYSQMMSLKKSSQVLKRTGQPTEYVVELDGGPIMSHSVELAAAFSRSARLVDKDPANLRVNDRSACNGLNGMESSSEWHEIKISKEDFAWNAVRS